MRIISSRYGSLSAPNSRYAWNFLCSSRRLRGNYAACNGIKDFKMLKRILPKEEKYFDRFDQMADLLAQASATMMTAVDHSAQSSAKALILCEYEVDADQITHTMLEYLHRTFMTPFDRNDIHALVFKMQKVVELLSITACRIVDADACVEAEQGHVTS